MTIRSSARRTSISTGVSLTKANGADLYCEVRRPRDQTISLLDTAERDEIDNRPIFVNQSLLLRICLKTCATNVVPVETKLKAKAPFECELQMNKLASNESARRRSIPSLHEVTLRARSSFLLFATLLYILVPVRAQQPVWMPREAPRLIGITPRAAAPNTRIRIQGYRLGANLEKGVRVIFLQGTAEYAVAPHGGEHEAANVEVGIQAQAVVVPAALQPGPCRVIVEVEAQRSEPFDLQITVVANAPVLTGVRPNLPQPGEMLWIEGTGFSDSDDFELTDVLGHAHHFVSGGTSNANTAAFALPKNFPGGPAHLRAIEHRSGSNQVSNTLEFSVVNKAAPLDVWADCLMPVSPGQWLDLVVTSAKPLERAELVEVSFRQNDTLLIVALEKPETLRVQVPSTLSPGAVDIQTRTWVAGEASAWSSLVTFCLLDKPAAAKVYSLEIRAVRAEAAFKQADRIVAISSVVDADYPRVRVPTDKLSRGTVQVMTRVWRGGRPSAWLFKHFGFDWPSTTFLPDGTMGEVPFMDLIYLGPDTPKVLVVFPGEGLILGGIFPVASAEDLQVTLECAGRLSVVLNPTSLSDPKFVKINLPDDLDAADWDVTVRNLDVRAAVTLPIKLRLVEANVGQN